MRDDFTASLRSACFHRYGHFVINLSPLLSRRLFLW
ncbi:gluconate 5-dehydrogenase, partial [Yersinia enterocolitica]